MAGRQRRNEAVYRSVSFKKLGSRSGGEEQPLRPGASDAAGGALPPEQPLSRKVSKISATTTSAAATTTTTAGLPTADPKSGSSTPLSSISPSIRQLTEKFSSSGSSSVGGSARTRTAPPGDGSVVRRGTSTLPRASGSRRDGSVCRKSFHEDISGGYFADIDSTSSTTTTATTTSTTTTAAAAAAESLTYNKVQKFHSGTDSVSGSDSEKRIFTRVSTDSSSSPGKRDYSQINACASEPRKSLITDEEEDVTSRGLPPPCKSHRTYPSTHHGDFIPLHPDKWPSVTKIRQLFDERNSKTDDCENLKAVCRDQVPELSPTERAPLADKSDKLSACSSVNDGRSLSLHNKYIAGAQSREGSTAEETHCCGMDFNCKADQQQNSNDEEPEVETQSSHHKKVSGRNTSQSSSSRSCAGGSHYRRINPSPFRSHSPSTETEAVRKTPGTPGSTSDPNPDLQPPATTSWSRSLSLDTSCCSSSLQQPTVRERRDRQGVGLPRDSLHSSHSSSIAPAPTSFPPSSAPAPDKAITSSSTVSLSAELRAPARVASSLSSRWRFSSGDEEEEHNRRRRGGGAGGWSAPSGPAPSLSFRGGERGAIERGGSYLSRNKNGWLGAKGIGRSSGSEEDSPGSLGPHVREAVRRRSLRKKKKVTGAALATGRDDYEDHDGESEDSDSKMALTMEQLERQRQQNTQGEFPVTLSRRHSTRGPSVHSNRARVQQWERISSPMTSSVSRVSKVNIPPFVSSPGGSRCSSRYSSTETLKEEGNANREANVILNAGEVGSSSSRTASLSMLSKTYHGNFTMYRSPSFGHGDNFSRTPLRLRPKILPTVTPSPTVPARECEGPTAVRGGEHKALKSGDGVDDDNKNQISLSNPDIASETLTLLSFLKSDLSELKVRKPSGGDRSGVVEGSVYRMGSRTQGGTLLPSGNRPSLKDLTATLRRAKSFTYSDKPTTAERCYFRGGPARRSSSEQQLDLDGEKDGGRVSVSDREVESDGGDFRGGRGQRMRDYGFDDDNEEVMQSPLQERYVQEARQVIRDICQMSTSKEDEDDDVHFRRTDEDLKDECFQVTKTKEANVKKGESVQDEAREDQEAEFKNTKDRDKHGRERENRERERTERDGQNVQLEKLNSRGTEYGEEIKRETERALLKGDSEESMFYNRSLDELSGHESSLTDEGIVTEPEVCPGDSSERSFLGSAGVNLGSRIPRDVLGQPVTVWKQSALHEGECFKQEGEEMTENRVSCTNLVNEVAAPHSLPLFARMAESDCIIMDMSSTAGINTVNATSEEINTTNVALQGSATTVGGGLETPATPSAVRRRRKFSPSGNNNTGSDSSNGSNAESTTGAVGNGDTTVYRSLSDPMPQRCCTVAEEGNNTFSSVDSNLLGSLSVKGGGGVSEDSAVATLSEYKGSVASDLSVYSDGGLRDDGIHDYSGVIRSIVSEPGAMDRLMTDDHGNGKAPKKKSFSDPSRRSDAPLLTHNDPQCKGQPISELDQPGQIPPSSSEPILSEQRGELWEPEAKPEQTLLTEPHRHSNSPNQVKKARSQSEGLPHTDSHGDEDNDVIDQGEEEKEEELRRFNFDLQLAEVLLPRMIRRPARKRPNRLAHFFPHEDPFEPPEQGSEGQEYQSDQTDLIPPLPSPLLQSKPKNRPKHVRHASEPSTFIPISPPPQLQSLKEVDCLTLQPTAEAPMLSKPPGDEAPSLEAVTQKYILELSTSERDTEGPGPLPVPLPVPRDGAENVSASEGPSETSPSGITEARTKKKGTEEAASVPTAQRSKPRVVINLQTPAVAVETQILKADASSHGDSNTELANSQVINLETPAVAVETQILKADPSSHGDSNTELANSQVINLETPAVAVETQILKAAPSSHGDSNTELANSQVINLQTPAVAVETQILKAAPSSHGDSNTELANSQVINLQTPAVAVETQILKADASSHGDSNTELANSQVINLQTPAVAVETQILKAAPSSHGDSNTELANSQVINLETPAVAVETQILKADPSSHGDSNTELANSQDMRKHVMMTLLDTEQSYVESLRTLIQGYMRPLKQPDGSSIVDPLLVDEMFYQIPEILEHHEYFLEQVAGCVSQWHDRQTVGHLLIQSFSKETLANMYSAYIDNFLNAKDAVRIAKEAKPAFHKFLEQNMRENKEKQALGDLMIKPVQRIPRYELLVKDLLKHTSEDHPDHQFLLDAQRDIKRLAEKINKGRRSAEEAERETRVIQEIEAHIEGVEHILNPQRKFLRQEMVMEAKTVGGKKDRSLFLFSDLIICTTLKRKSGSLRRSSMSLYSAASMIDTSSKYKFLWKLPLEDVEVVKSTMQATNKETIQKMISRLDEDLSTLGQISKISETLSFPHQSLDEAIKDLMSSVHRELTEKQSLAFSMTFLPTKLEFTTASAESSFVFEFTSPDTRSHFEQAFEDAKKKLAMNKDQWDPEFLKAIPIMKTRSGMQFSCASPSHSCPDSGCEVWVCNSDGYVGQVCLLNIRDEPTVEACIAVCSARIICIAAVPGLKGRERGSEPAPPSRAPGQQLHISISHSSLELTERPTGPGAELVPFDSDDTDDEDSPSPSSTLQSQASHSTISSSYGNDEGPGSKDLATETTSSEEEQEFQVPSSYGAPGMLGVGGGSRNQTDSPMDGRAMRRSSRGSFTRASLEDLLSIDPEAYQSSVWLGTEDGCIHVYQSSDNIRNRKNSMKMQHASSILCILFLDNKVFVSLANGEVIVYQREAGSFWDAQSSQTLVLGSPTSPVTKMVPVGGKLWCGSQNRILIINTTTLVQEHWFQVGSDSSRCVTCMVAYGQGVWLALQGSAQVRLYHAQTWESLTEVDMAPAVHKMLAGADAIIRQHKAACLRITALLACKDLLWIGTSAGVVLTLVIPAVSSGTGAGTLKSPLVPMGSAHGHTGHVRFLTSIELPEGFDMNFPLPSTDSTGTQSQSSSTVDGNLQRRDSARRRASAHIPPKTNHLVISGGDGYEDFRLTNSSETIGRDDSTNHLLLWRV